LPNKHKEKETSRMKYKAIATIILLLLPLVPLAVANQPFWNVELRIRPGAITYYGPCVVSTRFPVDVYLWNNKSLTGVGVYAYDFKVSWQNTAGIELDSFACHIPWPTGKYFLVKNETYTVGTLDYYHVAATAIGNSTIDPSLELGASSLFNASLVTLTFHITEEPCWPDVFHADFTILDYVAVTGCGEPITNWEIDNGTYDLHSSQPNIDPLVAANDPGRIDDHTFKESSIGETHTIIVALSNITGAYGFSFYLTWNPLWYDTDIQHVTVLPAFAPPIENMIVDMNEQAGYLNFRLTKPCEKPTLHAAGYTPVVSVSFVTTNKPMVGIVPYAYNTTFSIGCELYAKCPEPRTYTWGTDNGPTTLLYSGDVTQMFVPKSRADLDINGVVDVEDLAAVAGVYGTLHPWGSLATPFPIVDIFDLVYVAKRYLDP
jgi:hypothetical protein